MKRGVKRVRLTYRPIRRLVPVSGFEVVKNSVADYSWKCHITVPYVDLCRLIDLSQAHA